MLTPLPDSLWTLTTARHLIARAGFDTSPQGVKTVFELGLTKAVESLFFNQPRTSSLPSCAEDHRSEQREALKKRKAASPEEREVLKKEARRIMHREFEELQGWWLQQMIETPNPLQEKLTLFWHGHFATSIEKVKSPQMLWHQNEIFRTQGIGKFKDLLTAVSLDPAMLVYLDGNENQASHPNENFAREVMELFCLGEGHYTEKDIQESARAFTGWNVRKLKGKATFSSESFDAEEKTILGKRSRFNAEEALHQIASQPSCAEWICGKIWNFFAATPHPEAVKELSKVFIKSDGEIKIILQTLFKSEAFYSTQVMGSQIKGPLQWLISSIRLMERPLPPTVVCINLLTQLGQVPFRPPNVKGWDGGISWITTANLLHRYNFAALLVEGVNIFQPNTIKMDDEMNDDTAKGRQAKLDRKSNRLAQQLEPLSLRAIFTAEERGNSTAFLSAIQKRFLITPLKSNDQKTLLDYLSAQPELNDSTALHAIRLLMSTTAYQLT